MNNATSEPNAQVSISPPRPQTQVENNPAPAVKGFVCRVGIKGVLDARWTDYLGGFSVEEVRDPSGTKSILTGTITDANALLGMILYLHHFGMPLVCIEWNVAALQSADKPQEI